MQDVCRRWLSTELVLLAVWQPQLLDDGTRSGSRVFTFLATASVMPGTDGAVSGCGVAPYAFPGQQFRSFAQANRS